MRRLLLTLTLAAAFVLAWPAPLVALLAAWHWLSWEDAIRGLVVDRMVGRAITAAAATRRTIRRGRYPGVWIGAGGAAPAREPMHMAAAADTSRTLTISEAAAMTGRSAKSIRSRVDRGTIRAVLKDGVRRIPRSELVRAGLIDQAGDVAPVPPAGSHGAGQRQGSPAEAAVVAELLDRLERQAGELAELRLLTRQAESLQLAADQERGRAERLEGEVHELRAKLAAAEARAGQQARRRWWQRGDRGNPEATPTE